MAAVVLFAIWYEFLQCQTVGMVGMVVECIELFVFRHDVYIVRFGIR